MATAFVRTLHSLETDRSRRLITVMIIGVGLLCAWSAWFFSAAISLYEVSDSARIEVDRAAHTVQSPLLGKVVASHLELGRLVHVGDLLLELDAQADRLRLREEEARLIALDPQLRALREETAVEEQALARDVDSARAAHEEAKARLREAEVRAEFAGQDVVRLRGLKEEGLIPRRDFDEGTAEAESLRAGAESLNLALTRLDREQKTRESDRKARLKRLQSEISNIEGQKINTQAVIASLKYEIEKHMVRAPVDGRLGEVATLRVGAVVREGEKLGAIIPGGRLRVVADFSPAAVFGRVHTGQPGRLRLDGFPWAQYGSISATVIQVASEIREGRVRVELSLDSKDSCTIPKQHGLPGVVEVQVEKVTPATLALRSAGRLIASPRAAVEVAQK